LHTGIYLAEYASGSLRKTFAFIAVRPTWCRRHHSVLLIIRLSINYDEIRLRYVNMPASYYYRYIINPLECKGNYSAMSNNIYLCQRW